MDSVTKAAFFDELEKIGFAESAYSAGTDFRTPVRPSRLQPGPMPRADRGGSPVSGHGFEPTRGGFMLASGVQGPLGLTKGAEKLRGMNGDHLQYLLDKERGDGEDRGKEKDSDGLPDGVTYGPGDFKKPKLASPLGILSKTRHVGTTPNALGSKGPSIGQIAKPFGFGRAGAMPGTDKGGKI